MNAELYDALPAACLRSASTFTVSDATTNAPVTGLCPGGSYAVLVAFPEPRRALLTTSVGNLSRATDASW